MVKRTDLAPRINTEPISVSVLRLGKRESMTRPACLLLIALAGGTLLPAADGDVVFRSDVSLVRVDAQVVDRDNRAITGLHADDFILREQGQAQQISNFASENMAVDVLLLLDVSASMRPHVERIASAAHQALGVLGPQDRVGIMVFDRASRLRLPFRNHPDEVERELASLLRQETFNGGTDITRGLLDAANYVAREGRPNARRAIVILTDDQTERNRDEAGVSRALTKADAVLCLLLAPDAMQYRRMGSPGGGRGGSWPGGSPGGGSWPGGGGGGPLGGIILGRRGGYGGRGPGGPMSTGPHTQSAGTAEIARRSGGDSVPVDDASALETTLARIRQSYALHFHLPEGVKPGEERAIEVQLADAARRRYPNAEVRYRRVYLTPNGAVDARAPSTPAASEPVVVSHAPARDNTEGPPRMRRQPAASDVPDGPHEGPLDISRQSAGTGHSQPTGTSQTPQSTSQPKGGWRRADDPTPQADPGDTAVPDKTVPDKQPTRGWRKVKPGEEP
jgi:VWFA-related protein